MLPLPLPEAEFVLVLDVEDTAGCPEQEKSMQRPPEILDIQRFPESRAYVEHHGVKWRPVLRVDVVAGIDPRSDAYDRVLDFVAQTAAEISPSTESLLRFVRPA